MMRESLMTDAEQRKQTEEMAQQIGRALEELCKATGSVAHLYKNLEVGPAAGQFRLQANSYDPLFAELVRETGSIVQRQGGASTPRSNTAASPQASPVAPHRAPAQAPAPAAPA
jgi:hypothetical protein